jgi:hypothetical protein
MLNYRVSEPFQPIRPAILVGMIADENLRRVAVSRRSRESMI